MKLQVGQNSERHQWSRTFLSWTLSLFFHGTIAASIFWLPADAMKNHHRPSLELTDRQLPPLDNPLPKKPSAEMPSSPEPKPIVREHARRRVSPPPPAAAQPPDQKEQQPKDQAKASSDENTGPQTFGIQMSGTTTAAQGQGIQVPVGTSMAVSPKINRHGKSLVKPKAPGFKSHYAPNEEAPVAALTTTPQVLKKVSADYPEKMKELGIEGRVNLELTIDVRGRVVEVNVLRSLHPDLDVVAQNAAKQMLFSPATLNGEPVKTKIAYTFTFVLD